MNPLLVPELFLCILDCLTPPPDADYVEAREWDPTLAALARTCRAFTEPSLDLLWRRLDSLLPLVWSFSDIVYKRQIKRRIKVPSTADEWHIVNRYLPRIQWLDLSKGKDLDLLWSAHLVLPNLKVFRWCGPGELISDAYRSTTPLPLLTPNIDTLEVSSSTIRYDDEALSLLNDYPRLCPNLKSIKFNIHLNYSQLHAIAMEPLSRTLCGRVDWERVEISYPIVGVASKHLAKSFMLRVASFNLDPYSQGADGLVFEPTEMPFPDVTSLPLTFRNYFDVITKQYADGLFFEPTETPFPNVTNLSLTFRNHFDVATKLLRPRDQAFHSLVIHVQYDETTATEVSALFAAIPSSPRIHSLRSLTVEQPYTVSEPPDDSLRAGLSYKMFLPITSLVHLRELVIRLRRLISIDDHDFSKLISNWPCLEVLHFVGTRDGHLLRGLGLTALTSLASCKDLRRVAITLDARRVVEDVSAQPCCPAVAIIEFVNCPIGDPELVADFLAKHAPLAMVRILTTLLPERMLWETYDGLWREQVQQRAYRRLRGNAVARRLHGIF